jgi:alpha-glucosidase
VLAILALPGATYLFQGEELGLEDVDVPPQQRQDPIWTRSGGAVTGRDGCRAPIPWTSEGPGYGFTSGTPWLPFGPDAADRSAAAQLDDESSMLTFYREALAVRRKRTPGAFAWLTSGGPAGMLAFQHGELICALNTSKTVARLPLTAGASVLLASGPGVALEQDVLTLPADTATWLLASDLDARTKTAP